MLRPPDRRCLPACVLVAPAAPSAIGGRAAAGRAPAPGAARSARAIARSDATERAFAGKLLSVKDRCDLTAYDAAPAPS